MASRSSRRAIDNIHQESDERTSQMQARTESLKSELHTQAAEVIRLKEELAERYPCRTSDPGLALPLLLLALL